METNFDLECNAIVLKSFDDIIYMWPFIKTLDGTLQFANQVHDLKGATDEDYPNLNCDSVCFWFVNYRPSEKGGLYLNKICFCGTGEKEFGPDKMREKVSSAYKSLFVDGLAKKLSEPLMVSPDENGNYPVTKKADLGNGWTGIAVLDEYDPKLN